MTLEVLYRILQQIQLPLAYNRFKSMQAPPYLIYFAEDSSNFGADNTVYHKIDNLVIELYTHTKDQSLETQLEALLNAHDLYYEKYEVYIDSERIYQVRYEI
jgi:phosphomevalonate kinase